MNELARIREAGRTSQQKYHYRIDLDGAVEGLLASGSGRVWVASMGPVLPHSAHRTIGRSADV